MAQSPTGLGLLTSGEQDQYKEQAALRAVELITSGMVVGLGSGGTALYATRRIAALIRTGELRDVVAVPTSIATETEARRLGIPLLAEADEAAADITIDGADEIDPAMDLIKGHGGALLREKIVAQSSRRLVIVADESKLSPVLGTRRIVPVEVVPFGWRSQMAYLNTLGLRAETSIRTTPTGTPFTTDQGNFILDCQFGPIEQPGELAAALQARAGVVAHGLFLGLATDLIIAGPSGVEHRRRR